MRPVSEPPGVDHEGVVVVRGAVEMGEAANVVPGEFAPVGVIVPEPGPVRSQVEYRRRAVERCVPLPVTELTSLNSTDATPPPVTEPVPSPLTVQSDAVDAPVTVSAAPS